MTIHFHHSIKFHLATTINISSRPVDEFQIFTTSYPKKNIISMNNEKKQVFGLTQHHHQLMIFTIFLSASFDHLKIARLFKIGSIISYGITMVDRSNLIQM